MAIQTMPALRIWPRGSLASRSGTGLLLMGLLLVRVPGESVDHANSSKPSAGPGRCVAGGAGNARRGVFGGNHGNQSVTRPTTRPGYPRFPTELPT
jgi:hypothetical protein